MMLKLLKGVALLIGPLKQYAQKSNTCELRGVSVRWQVKLTRGISCQSEYAGEAISLQGIPVPCSYR